MRITCLLGKIFFCLLVFMCPRIIHAQSFTGPTCVVPGVSYQYTVSTTKAGSISWCVTNGIITANHSSCYTSTTSKTITVIFNSGESSAEIDVTAPGYSTIIDIDYAPALLAGSISNASQTINYNTVPQPLQCPAAGGGCTGSGYNYRWDYSYDQVTWN